MTTHTPLPACRIDLPMPPIRSDRAREVARWFGLPAEPSAASDRSRESISRAPLPAPGQILLITGPSGSGKSFLLAHYRTVLHAADWTRIDLHRLRLPQKPVVDCFPRLALLETLRILSEIGLGEAWTYLRTPAELSEGQRWRLRLAIGLFRARERGRRCILLADEFAAPLDRITARIVARTLRRSINRSPNVCAIVATSHDDLTEALAPDLHLHSDFGEVSLVRERDE